MATTTAENTETTTANDGVAETSDETAQTGTADLPPGVNESGVENASRLVAAHRMALSESGYAFRLRSNVSYRDEFGSRSVMRGTVAKQFAPFRIRADVDSQMDNQTIRAETDTWANDSVALVRYHLRNRTAYRQYNATLNETPEMDPFSSVPTLNVADQASMSQLVEFALLTGEYEIGGVEARNGLTFTTLRATGHNRSLDERGFGNVTRYESTLVVDERGRVHRLNTTLKTNETFVHYEFELTNVGGVVVQYPRWAEQALATVAAAIDVRSAENHFVISHEDGERLPPGSEVRVSRTGANYTLELAEPLRTGEEVYVYFPDEGGAPVLTRDRPDEDAAARLSGEYDIEVVDPSGSSLSSSSFGFGSTTATPPTDSPAGNATETTTSAGG